MPEAANVMTEAQKDALQREIIQEGEEEPIEEENEGASPPIQKQKTANQSSQPATTKDSSSEAHSRNHKKDELHTFADEQIEFSESFKKRESLHQAAGR